MCVVNKQFELLEFVFDSVYVDLQYDEIWSIGAEFLRPDALPRVKTVVCWGWVNLNYSSPTMGNSY